MSTYKTTFTVKRLWLILFASLIASFSVLLFFGGQIYQKAPPIPERFETLSGTVVYTRADIERGQNIWQSLGGMQQGSVWGHGSYLAPDWSADWLHREALALLALIEKKEVFATAIISTLFVRMGILRVSVATTMILFATIIFLGGGVLGTFHHLYWSGTPVSVLALGATFSALEVVPLMVVGFEAYNHAKIENQRLWEEAYHWPFMFFGAVLVWSMVGAGLFGFLINPPIALYYMQGLNTTANHGHAALFGVYGMLGLGLTLFCLRGLTDVSQWNQKLLKTAFWSLNIGLAMMTFLSLLPQGLWQTYASINEYYAFARSAEFVHSSVMEGLVWARVPGDIVFSAGVFAFAAFVYQAFRNKQVQSDLILQPEG